MPVLRVKVCFELSDALLRIKDHWDWAHWQECEGGWHGDLRKAVSCGSLREISGDRVYLGFDVVFVMLMMHQWSR